MLFKTMELVMMLLTAMELTMERMKTMELLMKTMELARMIHTMVLVMLLNTDGGIFLLFMKTDLSVFIFSTTTLMLVISFQWKKDLVIFNISLIMTRL